MEAAEREHQQREKSFEITPEANPHKRLDEWHTGLRICHKSHMRCATFYERWNLGLGIPVVALTAIAGTAIFATLETSPQAWAKIFIGLLTVLAAILSSLQTFLRFSELAERHKVAAVKYGALRREIETLLDEPAGLTPEVRTAIRTK